MSRGGGRGGSRSAMITALSRELGVDHRDDPAANINAGAPALYPPLLSRPLPLTAECDTLSVEDHEYLVALKQEFLSTMHESGYRSDPESNDSTRKDIQRYTDRFRKRTTKSRDYNYDRMPKELRLAVPKKADQKKSTAEHKRKNMDVLGRLDSLAQKEESAGVRKEPKPSLGGLGSDEESETEKEGDLNTTRPPKEGEGDEDVAIEDEEDEEFNDYCDNYFDPGDDYVEEAEDNPDDAAVF